MSNGENELNSKLDPLLLRLVERERTPRAAAAPLGDEGDAAAQPEKIDVTLRFTDELSRIEAAGFELMYVLGNLARGRIPVDRLSEVAALDNVVSIDTGRPIVPLLNASVPDIWVDQLHNAIPARKGRGVVVGIVDTGIDYRHQCFRNSDGRTRLLGLWDQVLTPEPGESSPAPFGYGVHYTQEQIKEFLTTEEPTPAERHRDQNGHGTHVAGIAAGNGRAEGNCRGSGTFVGVAPEADLVVVGLDFKSRTQAIQDALMYISNVATGSPPPKPKPFVVNCSFGTDLGAHDGTDTFDQFIDLFVGLSATPPAFIPGRAIVVAAGNSGEGARHTRGTVAAGSTTAIGVNVPPKTTNDVFFDLWYMGADRFNVTITPPDGTASTPVTPGNKPTIPLPNNNIAEVTSRVNVPQNHDNNIHIVLKQGTNSVVAQGLWTITLSGTTVAADGAFHAWIHKYPSSPSAAFPGIDREVTLGSPATARGSITVASYATNGPRENQLSEFSSRGPNRTAEHRIDVAAPGEKIMSVRSRWMGDSIACLTLCQDNYRLDQGTSMAAPHVTGVVALMLEKNGTLTQETIRNLLRASARTDSFTETTPDVNVWGSGKLNGQQAVNNVPIPPGTGPSPAPSDIEPSSDPVGESPPLVLTSQGVPIDASSPLSGQAAIDAILRTKQGQHYAALLHTHMQEVHTLINTNRRVEAVWLRRSGPEIVRSLLYTSYDPDRPFPEQVNGQPVAQSLREIFAILRRYGSDDLRTDIERHGAALLELQGMSFNQLLVAFRAADAGADG